MERLIIIIICLFVVQEAYPQFNSIEFQKELISVKVIQSVLVRPEKEGLGQRHLFKEVDPIVEKIPVLLASLPLENFSMTSTYGYRSDPISGERKFHRGIDLKANHSQVFSMLYGKVVAVGHDPLLGNFVKVRHGKFEAVFGHLSQIWVSKDDTILPGSEIGISGSSGRATGDHLHLTIKKGKEYINPTLFIQMLSKLSTKDELIQFLSNQ